MSEPSVKDKFNGENNAIPALNLSVATIEYISSCLPESATSICLFTLGVLKIAQNRSKLMSRVADLSLNIQPTDFMERCSFNGGIQFSNIDI
jgi:hypothetical protein